jgi:lysyl-tRNA synthetase class 1
MLEYIFDRIGTPFTKADFEDRLERAKFWLAECSPENVNKLRNTRNHEFYQTLDEPSKKEIAELHAYLAKGDYDINSLQTEIYAIPLRVRGIERDTKEAKAVQGAFFKNVYNLLINKEKGPRLYLFLYAIEPEKYVGLLDFSYPKTQEEIALDEAEKAPKEEVKKEVEIKEPDPVEPFKDRVTLDDFQKLDFRVCKIVKAQEIRKSHNCLKLTLNDGIGERVIVSSIKAYYTPEELVGKKIIVFANLEPKRLTGVESNGMLLAASNNACGCKVIFVDDQVPEGTRIY